jgi:hypothetical protein
MPLSQTMIFGPLILCLSLGCGRGPQPNQKNDSHGWQSGPTENGIHDDVVKRFEQIDVSVD